MVGAPLELNPGTIPHATPEDYVAVFTAWPYANGLRHLGHAASLLPADVVARYFRGIGSKVLMVSGTDEYGTPNMIAAEEAGLNPTEFVDETSQDIREDFRLLGMSYDWFTRTTSTEHRQTAQDVFSRLVDSEYIALESMMSSYDSEENTALPDRYVVGRCPHCGSESRGDQCEACTKILDPSELINPVSATTGNSVTFKETQHYFLQLDQLAGEIRRFLKENPNLKPDALHASLSTVDDLRPRAITRDMKWGIPLPEGYELPENNRVLYVWFEAVIGYLSASKEWATHEAKPDSWQPWWQNSKARNYYMMGKDNVPFHTIVWPAILSALNSSEKDNETDTYNLPQVIASTGYMEFGEGKFSSSRGNVVYIRDLISVTGPDAMRYYFIAAGPENKDSTFSYGELTRRVNDELIAKWGNMISRTVSLLVKNNGGEIPKLDTTTIDITSDEYQLLATIKTSFDSVGELISEASFSKALKEVMMVIASLNQYISNEAPWKIYKTDPSLANEKMAVVVHAILNINALMCPFLPHASQNIYEIFGGEGVYAAQPEHRIYDNDETRVLAGSYIGTNFTWKYQDSIAKIHKIAKPDGHLFEKLDEEQVRKDILAIQTRRSMGSLAIKSK